MPVFMPVFQLKINATSKSETKFHVQPSSSAGTCDFPLCHSAICLEQHRVPGQAAIRKQPRARVPVNWVARAVHCECVLVSVIFRVPCERWENKLGKIDNFMGQSLICFREPRCSSPGQRSQPRTTTATTIATAVMTAGNTEEDGCSRQVCWRPRSRKRSHGVTMHCQL